MKILKIEAFPNGAHRNQEWDKLPIPDGWAVIPEDMELVNFPFGNVTAEEITHYRDVEAQKSREVPVLDDEGNPMLDEAGNPVTRPDTYLDTEPEPYGVMTVTGWKPLPMPEPEPKPEPEPTTEEILNAMLGVN